MRRIRKFLHSATATTAFTAMLAATAAHAQVIEIADDGSARTFNGPTRFVTGLAEQVERRPAAVTQGHNDVDSFERAARSEKIDVHLLRAVAWTESRGRANAVSPKGALGIMQLMPATAAELGVDARDVDSNISGGARYLARQLDRFQSVPLALAAYNAGPGAVQRWGGIPPYAETKAYVASIMSRLTQLVPATANAVVPSIPARRPLPAAPKNPQNILLIEVPSL
ncbi:MAG: lytic transglycosylase domain-containing protein [Steroidobacteraceae bacterium]